VLEQIRGKSVGEALAILEYTPRAAARLVAKVLRSAVANAEHNHQVRNLDDLRVAEAVADGGPSLKRVQPRAMGRAFFIRHRTSHLRVAVTDELAAGRAPRPPRPGAASGGRPEGRRRKAETSGAAGAGEKK
jgi:large subunit ribosomal protein L22